MDGLVEQRGYEKEQTGLSLSVVKTDANLARLPFFALSHEELREFHIELSISEVRGNEKVELFWIVTPNVKYGYPGIFARDVHRAVEYLLTRNGFPVPEFIDFSIYEIAYILEIEPSGRTYANIKQALLSIKFAGIESKGIYHYLDNGKKRWVEDYFNLYDRVIFVGEKFSDGAIADTNRIYFNKWYLKSLNSLFIKPLDFKYWKCLRSKVASRLYEYLSYISYATKCKPFNIEYRRLCKFLPIKPQRYLSLARQILSRAHIELIQTGFLKRVIWRESKKESKEWVIVYSFGERAEEEYKRGFQDDMYRPTVLAVETLRGLPEVEEEIEKEIRQPVWREGEMPLFVQELHNRGITKSVAMKLGETFPKEYIKKKIQMLDKLEMIESPYVRENPAGWLRKAIEDDYQLSSEQQREINNSAKNKEEKMKETAFKAKAQEVREQRIESAVLHFPEEDEWVDRLIDEAVSARNELVKYMPSRHSYTKEEIEEMRKDFAQKYPRTEEERRDWLMHQPEYRLDQIVKELEAEEKASD